MIDLLLLLMALPQTVVIATPRGVTTVPVSTDRGGVAVAEPLLVAPLSLSLVMEGTRASVTLGGTVFIFQLGVPYVSAGGGGGPGVPSPGMRAPPPPPRPPPPPPPPPPRCGSLPIQSRGCANVTRL